MNTAECVQIDSRCRLPEPGQHTASVEAKAGTGWLLHADQCAFEARQAASCLLTPQPGDRVLVYCQAGEAWVLAVLDRELGAEWAIETPGPMRLGPRSGDLSMHARRTVHVRGGEAIDLRTPGLGVRAATARLVSRHASWLCDRCEGRFNVLRLVGRACEGLFERFRRRARVSYREVETLDHACSGEMHYRADANLSLEGGNLLGSAEHLASIDGKQIHLG